MADEVFSCRVREQHVGKRFSEVREADQAFVRWVLSQTEFRNNNLRAFAAFCQAANDEDAAMVAAVQAAEAAVAAVKLDFRCQDAWRDRAAREVAGTDFVNWRDVKETSDRSGWSGESEDEDDGEEDEEGGEEDGEGEGKQAGYNPSSKLRYHYEEADGEDWDPFFDERREAAAACKEAEQQVVQRLASEHIRVRLGRTASTLMQIVVGADMLQALIRIQTVLPAMQRLAVLHTFFTGGSIYDNSALEAVNGRDADGVPLFERQFPAVRQLEISGCKLSRWKKAERDSAPRHSTLERLVLQDTDVKVSADSFLWDTWFPKLTQLHASSITFSWVTSAPSRFGDAYPPLQRAPAAAVVRVPGAPASHVIASVLQDVNLAFLVMSDAQMGVLDLLCIAQVCHTWQQVASQALASWRARNGIILPERPQLICCLLRPSSHKSMRSTIGLAFVSPMDALDVRLMPTSYSVSTHGNLADYPGQRRCDRAVEFHSSYDNSRPPAELNVRICAFKHALGQEPEEDCSGYDESTRHQEYVAGALEASAPGAVGTLFD